MERLRGVGEISREEEAGRRNLGAIRLPSCQYHHRDEESHVLTFIDSHRSFNWYRYLIPIRFWKEFDGSTFVLLYSIEPSINCVKVLPLRHGRWSE